MGAKEHLVKWLFEHGGTLLAIPNLIQSLPSITFFKFLDVSLEFNLNPTLNTFPLDGVDAAQMEKVEQRLEEVGVSLEELKEQWQGEHERASEEDVQTIVDAVERSREEIKGLIEASKDEVIEKVDEVGSAVDEVKSVVREGFAELKSMMESSTFACPVERQMEEIEKIKTSLLKEKIKKSWLMRFEVAYEEALGVQGDKEYKKAAQCFEGLLSEIEREHELHVGDKSFIIGHDLNKLKTLCYFNIGYNYLTLKNPDMALGPYEKALELGVMLGFEKSFIAGAHNNLGNALAELKRYEEAEEGYMGAIGTEPELAEAHNNLGALLSDIGQDEKAEKEFREAIRINPELAEAHYNFGNLLFMKGQYDKAIERYREAIRINSSIAAFHYNLGVLLSMICEYDEAMEKYEKAIELNPNDAKAHNNLGNLLAERRGQEDKAREEYEKAIELNPNDAKAHNNIGAFLAKLSRYEEAEKEFRDAIKLNPEYAEAHNNLGNVLFEMARYEKAEKEYRKAIDFNSDYPEAHNNLSILLLKTDRLTEAIDELTSAEERFDRQGRDEDAERANHLLSIALDKKLGIK